MASSYLHRFDSTYRSLVRHEQSLIGYPLAPPNTVGPTVQEVSSALPDALPDALPEMPSEAPPPDQDADEESADPHHQAVVAPSTPWRFIAWLGSLTAALCIARAMLLEANPNSTCHRVAGSVDPRKARSDARMATLETARQLLLIIPEWEACFHRPFFPPFATRSGFR